MKLRLPIIALAYGLVIPAHATEKFPFQYIQVEYSYQLDDHVWDPVKNKYTLARHKVAKNGLAISRMRVDGEDMLVAMYGGNMVTGCDVDGRFSMFSPMFRVGGKHSDVIRCSNPAKPGEKGTIKYSTTSSYSGGVLTIKSQATGVTRFPGSGEIIGDDATDRIEFQIKLDGGACRVIKGTYQGERKNFGLKGYAKAVSKVVKPKCEAH